MQENNELFAPFYKYLEAERKALLTKLDSIERIMGISPRTAEIRKRYNHARPVVVVDDGTIAGVVKYD